MRGRIIWENYGDTEMGEWRISNISRRKLMLGLKSLQKRSIGKLPSLWAFEWNHKWRSILPGSIASQNLLLSSPHFYFRQFSSMLLLSALWVCFPFKLRYERTLDSESKRHQSVLLMQSKAMQANADVGCVKTEKSRKEGEKKVLGSISDVLTVWRFP